MLRVFVSKQTHSKWCEMFVRLSFIRCADTSSKFATLFVACSIESHLRVVLAVLHNRCALHVAGRTKWHRNTIIHTQHALDFYFFCFRHLLHRHPWFGRFRLYAMLCADSDCGWSRNDGTGKKEAREWGMVGRHSAFLAAILQSNIRKMCRHRLTHLPHPSHSTHTAHKCNRENNYI